MPEKILKTCFYLMLGIMLTGCASVKARSYIEDKARVDQEIEGNAGYLNGQPPQEASQVPNKSTRKVYVLELTKESPGERTSSEDTSIESVSSNSLSGQEYFPKKAPAANDDTFDRRIDSESEARDLNSDQSKKTESVLSSPGADTSASFTTPSLPVQYTVSKDDTLQTIAKKFYNSYSKWPKIFEANKDKITDPNRIKTGLVLTIPAL